MKQLLILSGKGGTGKTTIASAFIRLCKARAYADCDVDAPNLHLVMKQTAQSKRTDYYGMPKAVINQDRCNQCGLCKLSCRFDAIHAGDEYKVDGYACEGCGVCKKVCQEGAISLVPAVAGEMMLYQNDAVFSTAQLKMGSGTSGMLVTEVKKQMKSAVTDVELSIIDGSPGIGCPVIASISGVDMVLIVAEPSVSGISDMKRIVDTAKIFQTKVVVCINKYDTNFQKTDEVEEFCQENGLLFVGKIPYDSKAVEAVNQGRSIADMDCSAGRAAKVVFDKTIGCLFKEGCA